MHAFQIVIRDALGVIAQFTSISPSSAAAEDAARARFVTPVGITVRPV